MALDGRRREARPLELGHADRHLARARGRAPAVMAGAVSLPLGGAPVAPGADELVGLRLEQAVQRVLDGLPDRFAKIGPEALLVQCYDGFGHGNLRYASCLDNSNHTEAGRALPSIWTLFRCQSAQKIVRYPRYASASASASSRSREAPGQMPDDVATPS